MIKMLVTIALILLMIPVRLLSAETIKSATAAELFERFKQLEGTWRGKSSVGWEDRSIWKVIARGSVLMSTSEFVDEPGEGMASMYHLDGDQFLLTHYCEAGNVPVLRATSVDHDGKEIAFEFLRGTNLPSRDKGHMDSVIVTFVSKDHFKSRWTWYQDGKEKWLEEIEYFRIQ